MSSNQSESGGIEQEGSICLAFDKAVDVLPPCLLSKDERELHQLSLFLLQVDELHQPSNDHNDAPPSAARSIFNAIKDILKTSPQPAGGLPLQQGTTLTRSQAFDSLYSHSLLPVTEVIATKIASNVIRRVDSHDISISMLDVLKKYSWETKVALMVTTYILTFGNFGLNLCPQSKVSLKNTPLFVKQLLEVTSKIVNFEKLPPEYMTSKDPKVVNARTQFIVIAYWVSRAIATNAAFYINAISSKGYRFVSTIEAPLDERLEDVGSHLITNYRLLRGYFYEYDRKWNTVEKEDQMKMFFTLPGQAAAENIDVKVIEDMLVIRDVTGVDANNNTVFGPYEAQVPLPTNSIKERITAVLNRKGGMLWVIVPLIHKSDQKVFQIPITSQL